jgi:hypothetical protein
MPIVFEPKKRATSRSIILANEAGQEPLPGSRGMDKYDNLDQHLMVMGRRNLQQCRRDA